MARLVTSKNRLPLGAPTSPVLSNMVCIDMDHQLDKLAFVRFIKGPNHGLCLKLRFLLADGMVGVE